ncbi:MAG: putative thioredoxin [Acidimicrobiales bacterium]|jgi:putative thioredoxin|nr:putative thioredoxin [Acidimicrobiales bacterium]
MADVTDQTFEQDVIERSKTRPVVVDLWAEWCGPCKTLGPILEKVIEETGGEVELAKVDVDANPQISRAFQVQSIPAVYALKDGKVVDGFVGAQPEEAVRTFVAGLAGATEPTEVERLVELGDEESLRKALEIEPDNEDAIVGLGEHLVVEGRPDEALALLARIPESAETRRVAALARVGVPTSDDDTDAQLETLLPQVKDDEEARQRFVDLLELLGPDDPRTASWRKRLTAQLF